ncbi:phenylalanine--tRNA ligase, mitochondrial-like [Dysidea avara]|uniref:phenylalanine--tRNA ligase, mitochondrial-like n=1 Tax=Dysidea avara TaxID=196820 RepID=UPI0033294730
MWKFLLLRNWKHGRFGVRWMQTLPKRIEILGQSYETDEMTSVTSTILSCVPRKLHLQSQHPLGIIKNRIIHHFNKTYTTRNGNTLFASIDDVSPVVTVKQNFESLLIPPDHPSRSKIDNYYLNSTHMLRSHTSAHEKDFMRLGFDRYLLTGDVYRRDEIDSNHYPVFHQMEGVRLFVEEELFKTSEDTQLKLFNSPSDMEETSENQAEHTADAAKMLEVSLKSCLTKLVQYLFGENIQTRWVNCYFPFTHPSYELEIKFRGEWLEVLGSGILRQDILKSSGVNHKAGWAFGLGLDRLAMLLFQIPDIRLLWSEDPRFLDQFKAVPKTDIKFTPFSKYPACYKDISFWLQDSFTPNDFYEVVRSICGNLVEEVKLIDEFRSPDDDRVSHCYRILYRSMDKTFTNDEINLIHNKVADSVSTQLSVTLR